MAEPLRLPLLLPFSFSSFFLFLFAPFDWCTKGVDSLAIVKPQSPDARFTAKPLRNGRKSMRKSWCPQWTAVYISLCHIISSCVHYVILDPRLTLSSFEVQWSATLQYMYEKELGMFLCDEPRQLEGKSIRPAGRATQQTTTRFRSTIPGEGRFRSPPSAQRRRYIRKACWEFTTGARDYLR